MLRKAICLDCGREFEYATIRLDGMGRPRQRCPECYAINVRKIMAGVAGRIRAKKIAAKKQA